MIHKLGFSTVLCNDCMSTWVVLVMSCVSPVGIKSTTFGMLARMPYQLSFAVKANL